MAFCKKVPRAIFDLPGEGDTYACVTIVPMGWPASVDLIQNFLRKFVYEAGLIHPSAELRVVNQFPTVQAALTHLDGFDSVTKEPPAVERDTDGRLYPLSAFVALRKKTGAAA